MFGFFWRIRNSERYIKHLIERRNELITEKAAEMVRADRLEIQLDKLQKDLAVQAQTAAIKNTSMVRRKRPKGLDKRVEIGEPKSELDFYRLLGLL